MAFPRTPSRSLGRNAPRPEHWRDRTCVSRSYRRRVQRPSNADKTSAALTGAAHSTRSIPGCPGAGHRRAFLLRRNSPARPGCFPCGREEANRITIHIARHGRPVDRLVKAAAKMMCAFLLLSAHDQPTERIAGRGLRRLLEGGVRFSISPPDSRRDMVGMDVCDVDLPISMPLVRINERSCVVYDEKLA